MSDSALLRATLTRLRRFGWVQRAFRKEETRCLLGATPAFHTHERAAGLLAPVIREQYPDCEAPDARRVVMKFNDTPGRTWEEVESIVEKAIAQAEEQL